MRILHLIDSLQYGGAQKLLVTFCSQARQHGMETCVASLNDDAGTPLALELKSLGARIYTFPGRRLISPGRFIRLVRFLQQEKFDVLHTHLSFANISGSAAARVVRLPAIVTLHSVSEENRPNQGLRDQLEGYACRHWASRIHVVGKAVQTAHAGWLDRCPVDVIANSVPIPALVPEADRLAAKQSICGDLSHPLVLSVGRLVEPKGYNHLVTAAAVAVKSHPELVVAVAGDGPLREPLQKEVDQLGLQQNFRLLGQRDDIYKLLAAADIYACSSLWEGLPLSILEAMLAGLPVVATAVGEIPQVVKPEIGLLVPASRPDLLAAALCALLDDPSRRKTMGAAAHQVARQAYHPKVWFERLLEMYTLAAKQAGSR